MSDCCVLWRKCRKYAASERLCALRNKQDVQFLICQVDSEYQFAFEFNLEVKASKGE